MNSLTDLDLIAKLSEASQAGVDIKMIVRGICCILPGLEGYTDHIEIHSVVGRFLEHGTHLHLRHRRIVRSVHRFRRFH